MTSRLNDKVAIVTGGGSGIGEALSRELARRGARVVVADIAGDDAKQVAEAIADDGGKATASRVDVTREQDVTGLVEETAAVYGRLDYQFNNAGIAIGGDVRDLTLGHWREVLDVDLNGVLYGTVAAYPIMVRQGFGHIVNTSSGAGGAPADERPVQYRQARRGGHVPVAAPRSRRPGRQGQRRLPWVRANSDLPDRRHGRHAAGRGESAGPAKMVEPGAAARTILAGVARNRPVIAFPGYIGLAWRLTCLFPRLADRTAPRQVRELRRNRV